ncbi:MAG: class I SAM-dependent methyltransferase [Actinomycetes bacterium]
MDWFGGARRRRRLLQRAHGRVLEVGVGTGLSFEHYPSRVDVTGVDVSHRMLERARRRAASSGLDVVRELADVERLPFDDEQCDTVTAMCVFCSVADPVRGLRELARVVRPDGAWSCSWSTSGRVAPCWAGWPM